MKQRRSEYDQDFVDGQVCLFRCGQPGCDHTFFGTLADWLAEREAHRYAVHPGYRPPKRRFGKPNNATQRDYEGRLTFA